MKTNRQKRTTRNSEAPLLLRRQSLMPENVQSSWSVATQNIATVDPATFFSKELRFHISVRKIPGTTSCEKSRATNQSPS
jgi:hypothetical protein